MNKNDLLVEKSESKEKNSKKQKIADAEISELLAGIRTLLKSDEKN